MHAFGTGPNVCMTPFFPPQNDCQEGRVANTGGERGNPPRVQGFTREVTGKETGGNELAPPVANCCGGRGNILRRACECLAAAAKRLGFLSAEIEFLREIFRKDTKKIAEIQGKLALFYRISFVLFSLIRTFAVNNTK